MLKGVDVKHGGDGLKKIEMHFLLMFMLNVNAKVKGLIKKPWR